MSPDQHAAANDPVVARRIPEHRGPDRVEQVVVGDGHLTIGRWGDGPVRALLSHGITANLRSFDAVATALADRGVAVVAVDHRGRGASGTHPGPYGLATHADDLVAVADHVGAQAPVLLGHSMGGWIVANAAMRHPDRFAGLVLVDGGLPVAPAPLPAGVTVDQALGQVLGPAMARLELTFESIDEVLDRWREHPAVGPILDEAREYLVWDLVEEDGQWRSRVSRDAVIADGGDILTDEVATTALARTTLPSTFLRAPRDLLDQPPGFHDPDLTADVLGDLDHVELVEVDDVNHYSIVFTVHGIAAVVAAVEQRLR